MHVLEREPHLVLPPEVVDDGELNQGGEDEGRASTHPDVDGLNDKTNNLGFKKVQEKLLSPQKKHCKICHINSAIDSLCGEGEIMKSNRRN